MVPVLTDCHLPALAGLRWGRVRFGPAPGAVGDLQGLAVGVSRRPQARVGGRYCGANSLQV